jgi:hypothetical protein
MTVKLVVAVAALENVVSSSTATIVVTSQAIISTPATESVVS